MQGQYKVPGGKLVVADFAVVDGRLRQVRIHGDFFLEPDAAIDAINAALDGLPAATPAPGLAAAVEAALPPGTVMFGFDSAAIAVAIGRGLAAGEAA